jgi:transcriptional regulator with XRE-family HTH domain
MTDLGKRIAARREALGFSQKELGQRVGELSNQPAMTQQAIDKIERGVTKRTGSLAEIADALGVTIRYLKTGEEDAPTLPGLQAAPANGSIEPPAVGRRGSAMDSGEFEIRVRGIVDKMLAERGLSAASGRPAKRTKPRSAPNRRPRTARGG